MFQQTLAGTVLKIIKGFVPSTFVRTVFQQTLAGTVNEIVKDFFQHALLEQCFIRALLEHHELVILVVPSRSL